MIKNLLCITALIILYPTNLWAQFNPGQSLDFDGVDEYVSTNYPGISGTGARTISAWIKPGPYNTALGGGQQRTITDWGAMTPNGSRYTTAVQWAPRNFRTEIGGNGNQGPASLIDQKWHYVVVVWDPSQTNKAFTYVDGVLDWNGNYTVTLNSGSIVPFRIGARVDTVNTFLGQIDEVRVWNYAKSITQIQDDMFRRAGHNESGLTAYVDFDMASNTANGVPFLNSTALLGTMNHMESTDIMTSLAPIHWDTLQSEIRGLWSVNPVGANSGGVTIEGLNTLTDNDYVTYGHNNMAGTKVTADVPPGVDERYNRIWSFDQEGTVNGKIIFDLSTIEGLPVTALGIPYYTLLYRPGTSGPFVSVMYPTAIANTDQVEFSNFPITDGYYTLGFINNPTPEAGNTASTDTVICTGTAITLSLDSVSSYPGQTYQWQESSNNVTYTNIAGATSDTLNIIPGTNTYYRCLVTLVSNTDSSTPLLITVNALPNVTVSPSSTQNCNGGSSTFLVATGASSYTWMPGSLSGDTVNVTPAFFTIYTVTGVDAATGCSNTNTASVAVTQPYGWLAQATDTNTVSNTGTDCDYVVDHMDGDSLSYFNANCRLVCSIYDTLGGNNLGWVNACVTVDSPVNTHNGQPYVPRWYQIDVENNGPAEVSLYFTDDDFQQYNLNSGSFDTIATNAGGATTATVCITQWHGTGGIGTGAIDVLGPLTANWNPTTSRWEVTFTVDSFSTFTCHTCNPLNVALPATISNFTGYIHGWTDILHWETSSENNNDYFTLQHSTDGTNFTNLTKVESLAENGTGNSVLKYQFVNNQIVNGHHYYRLLQTDIDGNASLYSKTIDLLRTSNGHIVSLYPNPANSNFEMEYYSPAKSKVKIQLLDVSGKILLQRNWSCDAQRNLTQIDISNLSSGVYQVRLIENNRQVSNIKLTKQ